MVSVMQVYTDSRAWFNRNFTFKGLILFLIFIAKTIPDLVGRKEFWSTHVASVWKILWDHSTISTIVVCALLIWLDHRRVIDKKVTTAPIEKQPGPAVDLSFPDRVRLFSKELAAYLSNRMARPDEEEIWRKYGSPSSEVSSASQFAEKYNDTVQLWDDRLAAGYWLEYAERAAALRHELVLRRSADGKLDNLLSELEGASKGKHHVLMQELIERFRLLASQLD
jgi:hypothetical protein